MNKKKQIFFPAKKSKNIFYIILFILIHSVNIELVLASSYAFILGKGISAKGLLRKANLWISQALTGPKTDWLELA